MDNGVDKKTNITSSAFNPFFVDGQGPKQQAGLYTPSAYNVPEQEHDDPDYGFKGMVHPPTTSEGSFDNSAIYQENGIYYIIPTEGFKSDENAIDAFRMARDHMGGFNSLEAAQAFQKNDDEILNQFVGQFQF